MFNILQSIVNKILITENIAKLLSPIELAVQTLWNDQMFSKKSKIWHFSLTWNVPSECSVYNRLLFFTCAEKNRWRIYMVFSYKELKVKREKEKEEYVKALAYSECSYRKFWINRKLIVKQGTRLNQADFL